MNRKSFLTILTIITIFCVIFGTLYHVGDYFSFLPDGFSRALYFDDDEDMTEGDFRDLEDFHVVQIDVGVMGITIESGDAYSVRYDIEKERLIPEIEVEDGVLTITQKKAHLRGGEHCVLTITAPEDAIDKLDADIGVGSLDVFDTDIRELAVDIGTGTVDLCDCVFSELSCDIGVGDAHISGIDDYAAYSFDLDVGLGAVTIDGEDYLKEYKRTGDSGKSITIDVGTGDIEMD